MRRHLSYATVLELYRDEIQIFERSEVNEVVTIKKQNNKK